MPSPYSMPTLSDDQQSLLLRALQSNDRHLPIEQLRNNGQSPSINRMFRTSSNGQSTDRSVNPNALNNSSSPNSFGDFRGPTFGDSFLPDFTNGQQSDFDVDLPQDVSQTLSGFAHGDFGEKRKSPEDDDEDGVEAKRFEGDERISKKPGRKPVAAEPTTKRKAQNRAAQRAFRERKERHLLDLENKINDLQRTSATATEENSLLRAQVMRLQNDLQGYKKRLSTGGSISNASPIQYGFSQYQNSGAQSTNPFDFSFSTEASFNDFASLPVQDNSNPQTKSAVRSLSDPFTTAVKSEPTSRSNSGSFTSKKLDKTHSSSLPADIQQDGQFVSNSGDLFTPGFFNLNTNSYDFPRFGSPGQLPTADLPQSRDASNSGSEQAPSLASNDSPSASSNGLYSSAGTSPEPNHDQTAHGLQGSKSLQFSDLSSFQFNPDPSLFGDYREPQNNIFGDGDFSGGLYDDWLNMPQDSTTIDLTKDPAPKTLAAATNKMDLMEEVARHRDANNNDIFPLVPEDKKAEREVMTCHKIWQQLSTCPKFQQGEFDIDDLCSDLQKKATCSESGATISKDEWEKALWRIAGIPGGTGQKAQQPPSGSSVGLTGAH